MNEPSHLEFEHLHKLRLWRLMLHSRVRRKRQTLNGTRRFQEADCPSSPAACKCGTVRVTHRAFSKTERVVLRQNGCFQLFQADRSTSSLGETKLSDLAGFHDATF